MKLKITLLFIVMTLNCFNGQAQTQFWSDTFEDAGAPSSGTRTPENDSGTGSPYTSYFARTNNAGIHTIFNTSSGYQTFEGAKFWAGEDHDTRFGPGNEEQQIEWTGINVSGKSNLQFRGLLAANNVNAAFENFTLSAGASNSDYIIVEYRFNGSGAYTRLLGFFANNTIASGIDNKSLALDTDGNDVGDGTTLTTTFNNFQAFITGTGTTIDIRIRAYSNGTNEEWAIDNFRLFENVLGVENYEKNNILTLYPNPAKDNFKIVSLKDATMTLYNQIGQSLKQFNIAQNTETLITNEGLSKGVYFLVGSTSDGIKINEKIIIE